MGQIAVASFPRSFHVVVAAAAVAVLVGRGRAAATTAAAVQRFLLPAWR